MVITSYTTLLLVRVRIDHLNPVRAWAVLIKAGLQFSSDTTSGLPLLSPVREGKISPSAPLEFLWLV